MTVSYELTNLQSWAANMNEMFIALVGAGFTEEQALTLLGIQMGIFMTKTSGTPEGKR